ncbi:MAG: cellulose biosynthesis cyclic di-GMP-binding regulatory protein BcsB [Anaerolineales bacterium]|nr:cellulose biosynthesis cyclic di-GMP-binding regulatory protein BcsB [Anaerolineales bacterium]
MKKNLLIIMLLVICLGVMPGEAFALERTMEEAKSDAYTIQITDNRAVFTFADINYDNRNLISPIDTKSYIFSIPPNWNLIQGSEIELQYDVLFSGLDLNKVVNGNLYGGSLQVSFNDIVIATVPFEGTGTYTTRVQIPVEALKSAREDGRYLLTITLEGQLSCNYDVLALITIKSTSLFDLYFEQTSPKLDLSDLPAPFYLESSFVQDSVLVVVPDSPSLLELQGAINLMAGFGSIVEGPYDIKLVNADAVTDVDLATKHLVFVGKPSSINLLANINFPHPVSGDGFLGIDNDASEDGVLQLAISPWNPYKAVMLVSGITDEAVLKAAQAASSGEVITYSDPAVVFVSEVQTLSGDLPSVEDFSLKSLGYLSETYRRYDSSGAYLFYLSKDQILTRDGYVELIYYHSGMPTYDTSSFGVRLNGFDIADIGFKEETQQITTLQIKIPPGILRYGENVFEVNFSFLSLASCDDSGIREPWLTVSEETNFHIPKAEAGIPVQSLLQDLTFYPELFQLRSDLGDTAFIVSKGEPEGWSIAGQMAYVFGVNNTPIMPNLAVAYSDDVSTEIRENYSIISVGRASTSPFLVEINDSLPAPFDISTDTANERQLQIIYRIPAGVDVGYLEILPSPFNQNHTLLVVSGNSAAGLSHASTVLSNTDFESQLAGVFAVTNGIQLATGRASSKFSIVGDAVPSAEMLVATPMASEGISVNPIGPPPWFIYVLGVSVIVLIAVVVIVIKALLDRRRLELIKERQSANEDPSESL